LWALQILSGDQYLSAAQDNQLRTLRTQAPRGLVVDRNGKIVVGNVAGNSIQIWPADLPDRGRYQMLKRLSRVVRVPVAEMAAAIAERKGDPLTPVTVAVAVHPDHVRYIRERRNEFPGVTISQTYLRDYPYRAMAAHLLGHVGEVTRDQLESSRGKYEPGDRVGQAGVEATYDSWLRGTPGLQRLRVDSLGRQRSDREEVERPVAGHAIRLTIDVELQRAAERALRFGIEQAIENEAWEANGGAIVAMDPRTGEILAMASNPTYKPSLFVGRIDRKKIAPLTVEAVARRRNYPALNRVTAGLYPPGSTFKPVTALAAMGEQLVTPYEPLLCTGSYTSRHDEGAEKQVFKNWNPWVYAGMDLKLALAESCDTYFYQLGDKFFELPESRGHPLQAWATRVGFGQRTGIDVGPELAGLIPTPPWRQRRYTNPLDKLWKPGHSIHLTIGQGDLTVTPIQLTRLYALIANGGRLVTPHVVQRAEQPGANGGPPTVLQNLTPPVSQERVVDPAMLRPIQDGLYMATHYPHGTSAGVFDSFPVPIAGKTGTAEKWSSERRRYLDQSWWCGYGPDGAPTIVVCALIENGGHGGTAAAPAARKVFEEYFDQHGGPVVVQPTD
jgi:penicillin-binding protein 2